MDGWMGWAMASGVMGIVRGREACCLGPFREGEESESENENENESKSENAWTWELAGQADIHSPQTEKAGWLVGSRFYMHVIPHERVRQSWESGVLSRRSLSSAQRRFVYRPSVPPRPSLEHVSYMYCTSPFLHRQDPAIPSLCRRDPVFLHTITPLTRSSHSLPSSITFRTLTTSPQSLNPLPPSPTPPNPPPSPPRPPQTPPRTADSRPQSPSP